VNSEPANIIKCHGIDLIVNTAKRKRHVNAEGRLASDCVSCRHSDCRQQEQQEHIDAAAITNNVHYVLNNCIVQLTADADHDDDDDD